MTWRIAPILGAHDVEGTVDYYCTTLGFDCPGGVIKGNEGDHGIYAVLRRNGTELHIQIRRHSIWGDERNSVERSAYFYVNDVRALYKSFLRSHASIIQESTDMPYGLCEMVIEDLEGHRIAFGSDSGLRDLTMWEVAPILGTRDVGKTIDWFVTALKFDCPGGLYRPVSHDAAVYGIVFREQASIHIQIRRHLVFPTRRESVETDVILFIDNVDELYQEYEIDGNVRIHRELKDDPNGLHDFTVTTLDGHRMAFAAPR
ncbi:MAG: VOC family protein [Pseudomonadales bacterium]